MASTVDAGGVTSMRTGSLRICFESAAISCGMVAEKRSVCRFEGRRAMTLRTSWIKPMSSIRSASSRTNVSVRLKSIKP